MKYDPTDLVRKALILVSGIGFMNWGLSWLVMQEIYGLRIGVGVEG